MATKRDPFKIKRRDYSVVPSLPALPYVDLALEQGTREWHDARFEHVTASDIAAIMGRSRYKTRAQVLAEKLAKKEEDVGDFKRKLFEMGHLAEDAARRYANQEVGRSFKPMVIKSVAHPFLLASLDGFDVLREEILEAKYLGAKALEDVAARKIKAHHALQVQAQLLISGAKRCMYFAMDPKGNAQAIAIYPDVAVMNEILEAARLFFAEWRTAVKNG